MEVIFIRDIKEEGNLDISGYEFVRLSLRDRRVLAQVDLPEELVHYLTTLACPIDNTAFVIMGFKGGRVEIRDSLTLTHICFDFQFSERSDLEQINFHLDKFANLNVLHKNGVLSNLILERDDENMCFKRYIHNEDSESE